MRLRTELNTAIELINTLSPFFIDKILLFKKQFVKSFS